MSVIDILDHDWSCYHNFGPTVDELQEAFRNRLYSEKGLRLIREKEMREMREKERTK